MGNVIDRMNTIKTLRKEGKINSLFDMMKYTKELKKKKDGTSFSESYSTEEKADRGSLSSQPRNQLFGN